MEFERDREQIRDQPLGARTGVLAVASIRTNMQRLAYLGLDVAVTELDDRSIHLPAAGADLRRQAVDCGGVANDRLAVSRRVGVSQWGVDDAHSWIPGAFSGRGAATMYDANYQAKPVPEREMGGGRQAGLPSVGGRPLPFDCGRPHRNDQKSVEQETR
jgi:endo-1,4-beta-xylanase